MILLAFLCLFVLLPLCSFVPGFIIVRRFRWTSHEKMCASIVLSQIIIYLAATIIYWLKIDWRWCWTLTALWCVLAIIHHRDLRRFLSKKMIRESCLAYAVIFGCGLLMQSLAQHYSGGGWGNDWLEHYQRSLFFLNHLPFDTGFIGLYPLPARPPMSHLITAYFLGQVGGDFDRFQIIFLFLNSLTYFACILIAQCLVPFASRRVWLIAAFFITCPMVMQNLTYTWNKQMTAFFVLCSIAFYLRGWKNRDSGRIPAAAVSMAAAVLTHYSAGPYAVFLAIHYLFAAQKKKWDLLWGGSAAIALLCTWFAWSIGIYGAAGTFMTNTTATETGKLSSWENIRTSIGNIYCTIVPHPFHMTGREFGVLFDQPNLYGYLRDYFFNLYQPNLLLSLGIVGWAVVLWMMWKQIRRAERSIARFWIAFIVTVIILGVAVAGVTDSFGLAHICLQPLSLIGRVLLAGGFLSLRPWMRLTLVFSMIADVVLGIILQCRMQMHAIRDFHVGQMNIVPLSRGLLSFQAVVNSTTRFNESITYLADHFQSVSALILLAVILIFGVILMLLTDVGPNRLIKSRPRPRIASLIVLFVYAAAVALCISDRTMGFQILDDTSAPPTPTADAIQQQVAPLLHRIHTEPESPEAYEALGAAYYDLGQLDAAKESLENALLLNPDLTRTHYLLGLMQMLNNIPRPPDDPIFLVVIRKYQQDARSYVAYGMKLYDRGFKHKSIDVLADAVRRFPNEAISHQAFAMALFSEGKAPQAIEEITAALRLNPGSMQIADQMRAMLLAQGESPDSIEHKIDDAVHQR